MPCNTVILISGSGSNLQAFIDSARNGELDARLRAVISNRPAAKGLERAREAGIATAAVDHTAYASRDDFDAALRDVIDSYQPDLVILAGATVHFVTEELDGGPPVIHARVPIEAGDTPELLAARVLEQEHRIYPLAAQWYAQGRLILNGNRAELDGKALSATGFPFNGTSG